MNKVVKKKWLSALRSKKYRQGTNDLRIKGNKCYNHCCLGVLTELYINSPEGKLRKAKWSKEDPGCLELTGPRGQTNNGVLPAAVRRWAGLNSSNPMVPVCTITGKRKATLASINDGETELKGKRGTFKVIANIIEKSL